MRKIEQFLKQTSTIFLSLLFLVISQLIVMYCWTKFIPLSKQPNYVIWHFSTILGMAAFSLPKTISLKSRLRGNLEGCTYSQATLP